MKKEIKLVKNIVLSNFNKSYVFPCPYKLTFSLTYKCNLRCKICRIWEVPYRKELDINEVEKIFKGLRNLSWLDLTGGEITLREDLMEIVKVIIKNSKKLLIFHISTNGQLPHKIFSVVKNILKKGLLPIVNISIDGPRKVNDYLRGKNSAYFNSIETFKMLKTFKKGFYYISCTISNYNIKYLDEFISELKKDITFLSFSDLHFNIFHNSSHYYHNQDVECISQLRPDIVMQYLELSKGRTLVKQFLEDRYIKGMIKYFNGDRFPVTCQALKSSCFINPYGEVYPCGFFNRVIGDLKDYDYNLEKVWEGYDILKVRRDIENKNCPGCWTPCEAFTSILGKIFS